MLQIIHFVACAETAIGRFDQNFITDQQRMELLIERFSIKSRKTFRSAEGEFLEISDWEGVQLTKNENVGTVNFFQKGFTGTVQFAYIPPTVTYFSCAYNFLKGAVDTAALPRPLRVFEICQNKLSGTFDFTALPPALTQCNIANNFFTGSANLASLPPELNQLRAQRNEFSGSISLESLPMTLKNLSLSANRLSGSLTFENLPANLVELWLQQNNFTGSIRILEIPETTRIVALQMNALAGVAIVGRMASRIVTFELNTVTAVVDEHGKEYAIQKDMKGYFRGF